jgi:hypothetical protein
VLQGPHTSPLPAQASGLAPDLSFFTPARSSASKPSFPSFTLATVPSYVTPACPVLSSHPHSPLSPYTSSDLCVVQMAAANRSQLKARTQATVRRCRSSQQPSRS